jgi:hypothetical protein
MIIMDTQLGTMNHVLGIANSWLRPQGSFLLCSIFEVGPIIILVKIVSVIIMDTQLGPMNHVLGTKSLDLHRQFMA